MREVNQWGDFLTTEGKSKLTIKSYKSDIRFLLDWIREQRQVSEVDLELFKTINLFDLHSFLSYLINERGNSKSTVARRVNAIKNFYNYLCDVKLLDENNNVSIKLKEPKFHQKEAVYLTEEESQQFINNIKNDCHKKRNVAIAMLFLNTGIRLSELISIDVSDIKDSSIKIIGKGDKERRVCLNDETLESINEWLNVRPNVNTNALFISERKNRMDASNVERMIKNTLTKIGRGDCCTHSLRHTFCTMMLKHDVDIRTIQEMAGHASLATTQKYTHVVNSDKQKAVNKLNIKRA